MIIDGSATITTINTMKKLIAVLGLVLLLTSCIHGHFRGAMLSSISLGMSKAEVLRQLGEPNSAGAGSGVEVLHYAEDKRFYQFDYFFVRLVDGKVESYGPETKEKPVTDTNPPLRSAK
jgi:hypothetical protein